MKRVICDTCRTEAEPDTFGTAPEGWVDITFRLHRFEPTQNYCSAKCALEALAKRKQALEELVLADESVAL